MVRTLRVTIRVIAGHRVLTYAVDTGKPIGGDAEACLRRSIESAVVATATPQADVVIELRVWMQR